MLFNFTWTRIGELVNDNFDTIKASELPDLLVQFAFASLLQTPEKRIVTKIA
jgi:hypothetical protein